MFITYFTFVSMKKFLHLLLCLPLLVATTGVAFAQEGDETPEPTQTKMIVAKGSNVCDVSLVMVAPQATVYVMQQNDAEIFFAPDSKRTREVLYCPLELTAWVEKRMSATPWLHRCSRMC